MLINQMTASINHEINNPLAVILGQIELLLREKVSLPPLVLKRLESMGKAGRRIQQITEKLRSTDSSSVVEYVGKEKMLDIKKGKNEEDKLSVLVVDDDDNMNELFRDILTLDGYEVTTVNNGQDAVTAVGVKNFQIALVDMKMPGMDGLETLKKIRQTEPVVKVIMHTGYIEEEQISEALSIGAKGYIFKPFKPANLLEVIKKVAAGM